MLDHQARVCEVAVQLQEVKKNFLQWVGLHFASPLIPPIAPSLVEVMCAIGRRRGVRSREVVWGGVV